jgi:ribosomal protein S18 acetylase RimI-like enzyme
MIKIENITIREPRISDIVKLIKWYHSLSDESKRFFHPFPETASNPYFILALIMLLLSCIKILRRILLKILPQLIYISLCSIYSNEVVGFAFIKLKNQYYGELGIGIRDDFQGMGLGSKLMDNLIKVAQREGLKKIRLTVLTDNYRAIRLYEKFGFKKSKFIKDCDIYKGKKYDCFEMLLDL